MDFFPKPRLEHGERLLRRLNARSLGHPDDTLFREVCKLNNRNSSAQLNFEYTVRDKCIYRYCWLLTTKRLFG